MSKTYTFHCAVLGTNTIFGVTLNETQSVADLKEHIKATKAQTLAAVEADTLTLYKVNIDVSTTETFEKALGDISQNSICCVKEELRYPFSKLFNTFKESDLLKATLHILVKRPAGESINSSI